MGRPRSPVRDDPDAVSLHTTMGDTYRDAYTDDVNEDVPALDGDDAAPPSYTELEDEQEAGRPPEPRQDVDQFLNGVSPPETHIETTSYRIGAGRASICNEVISLQEKRSDADPDYLESWIKFMASLPPSPYIHITGTHKETRRDRDGKSKREDVTDFRLLISLQNYLWPNFQQYGPSEMKLITAEGGEKTYRGTVLKDRAPGAKGDFEVGHDKPSLKEWCHRYCAKAHGTKVFRLSRTVTGLDEELLRARLEGLIRGTNYKGRLTIEFPVADRAVDIYSSSRLNNWRLVTWIRWFFYLTFLWIFAWPVLFFTTKRYYVVRAEWPFSKTDAQGQKRYTTVSEEQWINRYAPAVRQLCLDRYYGMAGDTLLNQVLERGEGQQTDAQIDGRAALNVAAAAASAFQGGRFNAVNTASNLMRFMGGSGDQIGWGFDT